MGVQLRHSESQAAREEVPLTVYTVYPDGALTEKQVVALQVAHHWGQLSHWLLKLR